MEQHNKQGGSIYAVALNYYGSLPDLAAALGGTVVDGTIRFVGLDGPQVAALMEESGIDYNYSTTPGQAQRIDF